MDSHLTLLKEKRQELLQYYTLLLSSESGKRV